MKYLRLSYDLTESDPVPYGLAPPKIEQTEDMAKGDVSNLYTLTLCNHVGTHMDGPSHFSLRKKPLNAFPIDTFVFDRPLFLDMPKSDSQIISGSDLEPHEKAITACDLLLLRTGFGQLRSSEPDRYAGANPGIDVPAARFLHDQAPGLRAIGIDTISFAAAQHSAEGIAAHELLLDQSTRDIFLIEDMDLSQASGDLARVIALPLYFERVDSAPCTVLGIVL